MASYNKILGKIPVGEIVKAGNKITLSAATQTSSFNRPESIAEAQGPGFKKAVEASVDLIPEGTVEVCQRLVHLIHPGAENLSSSSYLQSQQRHRTQEQRGLTGSLYGYMLRG